MNYLLNYVYSVIDCPEEKSLGWTGLKGEEVFTFPHENISAVVSSIQTAPSLGMAGVESTDANWLKHDEVVTKLMNEHTVIPVKFGSVIKSDRDLRMMLRRILPECRAELSRFKDKIEMGVKVIASEQALRLQASKERTGFTKFRREMIWNRDMMARGRRVKLAQAVERQLDSLVGDVITEASFGRVYFAQKLYGTLSKLAVDARANALLGPAMVLNSSLLIGRQQVDVFSSKVTELQRSYRSFEFVQSGPWAPYNFTRIKYY